MEHICFLNTIFGRLKLPGFSVLWFEMHKELREKKRKEKKPIIILMNLTLYISYAVFL